MNTNDDPQPDPAAYELADFKERALARIADAFTMTCLGLVMMSVVTLLVAPVLFSADSFDDLNTGFLISAVLLVPASIPVVRYEVLKTSRRGYTTGKGPTVQVIRWEEYQHPTGIEKYPEMYDSLLRWAVPHGAALAAFIVAIIVLPSSEPSDAVHTLGLSFVVWISVYLSALFDKNRRGWHDKVAGTVVVKAPRPDPSA